MMSSIRRLLTPSWHSRRRKEAAPDGSRAGMMRIAVSGAANNARFSERKLAARKRIDIGIPGAYHKTKKIWERVPCVRRSLWLENRHARHRFGGCSIRRALFALMAKSCLCGAGSTSRKRQLPTCIVRSGPKEIHRTPTNSSNTIFKALLRLYNGTCGQRRKSIPGKPASCSAK